MMKCVYILLFMLLMPSLNVGAVQIYTDMPDDINPQQQYVIYSHGLIVEGDNATPVSQEYGVYDFPAIKAALFSGAEFNLIAHHRAKDTDIAEYTAQLESWVLQLLNAGVKPSRISLVGFSRGGYLTALASSRLAEHQINTVLLAACSDGDIRRQDDKVKLGGHLLSIYETTDFAGSCNQLAQRSRLLSFTEIAITTQRKHGAFYQPLPEWLEPVNTWLKQRHAD